MAAIKFIILCGLFAMALSSPVETDAEAGQFGDPEIQIFPDNNPSENLEVLSRIVRDSEPKRTVEARGEHNSRTGNTASVTYTHPVGRNVDVYGGASRDFRRNDNSGHVGVRYKF